MNSMSLAIGIPWFSPEDYDGLRAMMKDRDRLPRTHAEWLAKAEQIEETLRRDGHVPMRAVLDEKSFREFCDRFGLDVDSEGRRRYGAWFAHVHADRDGAAGEQV
jgi:hypothetical protein